MGHRWKLNRHFVTDLLRCYSATDLKQVGFNPIIIRGSCQCHRQAYWDSHKLGTLLDICFSLEMCSCLYGANSRTAVFSPRSSTLWAVGDSQSLLSFCWKWVRAISAPLLKSPWVPLANQSDFQRQPQPLVVALWITSEDHSTPPHKKKIGSLCLIYMCVARP